MATRIDYGITPNDINALAAVIATELGLKGKELGDKPKPGNYYSPLEVDAILDAMVLRQMISQKSGAMGSMDNNTLANVAMKPLQFSGLNEFSKNLYGNKDLTEDEYLAAIRRGLGSDISDELFNRAVADVNNYFIRRKEAGGNAIGPFKDNPVTHFINPRVSSKMAQTQDEWLKKHLRFPENFNVDESNYGAIILPKGFVTPSGKPLEEDTLWYPSHNFLYNTRYNPRKGIDKNPIGPDYTNFDTGVLLPSGERFIASPYNYSLTGVSGDQITPTIVTGTPQRLAPLSIPDRDATAFNPSPNTFNFSFDNLIPSNTFSSTPVKIVPQQYSNDGSDYNPKKSIARSVLDRFNRTMRGYNLLNNGLSDGTPAVPALYESIGSDWGPRHNAYLENAIGELMKRFGGPGKATNEQILNAVPDNIITDIRAQVNADLEREGRANTPTDPYDEIIREIPPMPQQYINDASQLTKPSLRIHSNVLENQRERREYDRLFGPKGTYPLTEITPIKNKVYPNQEISSLDKRFHPSDDLAMDKFTTDTVPAMLTPGEAVIPAESAQLERNRAEIQRMVDEGREIQERKDELNISPFDNSQNEKLATENRADKKKNRFNNKNNKFSFFDLFKNEPTYTGKSKRNIPDMQGPPMVKPIQGPSIPLPEEKPFELSIPDREAVTTVIDQLPSEGEPSTIPQQYINDASDLVLNDQQQGNIKFKGITDWIEKNLGFNKQDVYRALVYYVGGRLSGGSHGGSLRWAARQVIQESNARNTVVAKAQATAQSNLLDVLTNEAKQKLKDGYFTRAGSKAINEAIRTQDYSKLNQLLFDTENPSLYNQMAMISDLSKRKPYYIRGTNPLNNMIMAPHKDKNFYVWQDPTSGEILEIPMDQVEEYKKDIDYDNMFNKFKNDFEGYEKADKNDSSNNNTNYKKLKRHYNVKDSSSYRSTIKNISERYNVSPDRVFNLVTSLLNITGDDISRDDLNVDLETAIGSLIIDPTSMPDNDKLKNFNQKDINKVVEDFGGDPSIVTKHMQTIDTLLAGNPNANPPIPQKFVKDIKDEEVNADINNSNLSDEIKNKIKAIPNPYWKMVYLEFYTSRG